jgi:hypothetical protein
MDRSFLSDQDVVAASREFVCARLITFEDTSEAALMKRLIGGRSLVNTAFTIMDPAGKKPLVRAGRSTKRAFKDPAAMVRSMKKIAADYSAKNQVSHQGLPLLEDVRIALNVTQCDGQQLVIIRGDDRATKKVKEQLCELSWSDDLIGKFLYAVADEGTDWSVIKGADKAPAKGVLVVQSDTYGLTGKVVGSVKLDAGIKNLRSMLSKSASAHDPKPVDTSRLRRAGIRKGIKWETEIRSSRRR